MSPALSDECGIFEQISDVSEKLIAAGRYQLAAKILRGKRATYTNPALFLNLIYSCYCSGDYKVAIEECEKWARLDSEKLSKFGSFVFQFEGSCFLRLGEYEKALAMFKEALKIFPSSSAEAGRGVAEIMIDRKKPPGERQSLNSVLSLRGYYENTLDSTLQLLFAQGSLPAVETPSSQWAAKAHRKLRLYVLSAELAEDGGEFQKASELYRKAIEVDGTQASLWNELALCELTVYQELREKGLPVQSNVSIIRNACEKATRLGGADWRFWNNFGLCMSDAFPEVSKMAFEKVLQSPDLPTYQKGVVERAIRIFEASQRLKQRRLMP